MVSSNDICSLHHFRECHMYSVCDCLCPWEVLLFWLKLQAVCALWFVCKHIIGNTCYFSRGVGVNRVSNAPGNPGNLLEFFILEILEFYWNFARSPWNFMVLMRLSLVMLPFSRLHTIIYQSYITFYYSKILSVISENAKTSRDLNTFFSGVIYHVCTCTHM